MRVTLFPRAWEMHGILAIKINSTFRSTRKYHTCMTRHNWFCSFFKGKYPYLLIVLWNNRGSEIASRPYNVVYQVKVICSHLSMINDDNLVRGFADGSNKARPTQILLFFSKVLTCHGVSVNCVANISKFDFFDGKPQTTRLLKGSLTLQRANYLQEIRTFSPWCLPKLPGGTNIDNCLLRLKLFCFDLITWDSTCRLENLKGKVQQYVSTVMRAVILISPNGNGSRLVTQL